MKTLAKIITLALTIALSSCSTMPVRAQLTYSGRFGSYSVGTDGKTITLDASFQK